MNDRSLDRNCDFVVVAESPIFKDHPKLSSKSMLKRNIKTVNVKFQPSTDFVPFNVVAKTPKVIELLDNIDEDDNDVVFMGERKAMKAVSDREFDVLFISERIVDDEVYRPGDKRRKYVLMIL